MRKKLTNKQKVLKRHPQAIAFRGIFGDNFYIRFGRPPLYKRTKEYARERDAWAAAAKKLEGK